MCGWKKNVLRVLKILTNLRKKKFLDYTLLLSQAGAVWVGSTLLELLCLARRTGNWGPSAHHGLWRVENKGQLRGGWGCGGAERRSAVQSADQSAARLHSRSAPFRVEGRLSNPRVGWRNSPLCFFPGTPALFSNTVRQRSWIFTPLTSLKTLYISNLPDRLRVLGSPWLPVCDFPAHSKCSPRQDLEHILVHWAKTLEACGCSKG